MEYAKPSPHARLRHSLGRRDVSARFLHMDFPLGDPQHAGPIGNSLRDPSTSASMLLIGGLGPLLLRLRLRHCTNVDLPKNCS